jgi:hypothetical protein
MVDGRNRTRFCIKLLQNLNYTKAHPQDYGEVGVMSVIDGKTFFANTAIFGEFLRLQTNSINTNFREHGFSIIANGHTSNPELANLPNCSQWKQRHCAEMTTTEKEADGMETKVNR